ncbi:MAG: hypothetical protein RR912_06280 [Clostridium sp.]
MKAKVETEIDKVMYRELEANYNVESHIEELFMIALASDTMDEPTRDLMKRLIRRFNDEAFGEIGAFLYFIPIVANVFSNDPKIDNIVSNCFNRVYDYCYGTINRDSFGSEIWYLQSNLDVSEKFYKGLVEYFGSKRTNIVDTIIRKLGFMSKKPRVVDNIQWVSEYRGIESTDDGNLYNSFSYAINSSFNYYLSTYICPDCSESLLYKIKTRDVKTTAFGKEVRLFNLFTCTKCRKFYASIDPIGNDRNNTSSKLSDYALVSEEYDENDYITRLHDTSELYTE